MVRTPEAMAAAPGIDAFRTVKTTEELSMRLTLRREIANLSTALRLQQNKLYQMFR